MDDDHSGLMLSTVVMTKGVSVERLRLPNRPKWMALVSYSLLWQPSL
ncbi:hypothetical protein O9992_00385 [Vibrio lentus]|nr:hypothetical protein [Vibrio lentus]